LSYYLFSDALIKISREMITRDKELLENIKELWNFIALFFRKKHQNKNKKY